MNKYVYDYWNRTEFGRRLLASDLVSESDLVFLIPNNKKKMHGLPLTRISGSKKRKQKRLKRKTILSFDLFEMIEDLVKELVGAKFSDSQFFDRFVDFKDLNVGERDIRGVNI